MRKGLAALLVSLVKVEASLLTTRRWDAARRDFTSPHRKTGSASLSERVENCFAPVQGRLRGKRQMAGRVA